MINAKIPLKLARGKKTVTDQVAEIKIEVPSDRLVIGGRAWFENQHPDDYVVIDVVDDQDNILDSFTDSEVPEECQGWYICNLGFIDVASIGLPAMLPEGTFLRITGHKGDETADTLRINIKWGAE